MAEALEEMNTKKIGATVVIEKDGTLAGILVDGDLRRALLKGKDISRMKVEDIMTRSPKTINEDITAAEDLATMEKYGITHLIILDRSKKVIGILHLHDLLGREDFRLN